MKHLRKIATLIIAVIMAAAIAVGICVIYAVKNVNVTFLSYSDGEEEVRAEILSLKQSVFEKVRGRVISSVNEEDVASCLADDYFLESFEKVYPCTINITVQQRREVFAVFNGENYSIYDYSGKFMRTSDKNENAYDDNPNLILEGVTGENDVQEVAAVCSIFRSEENFGNLRSTVEKVTLYKSQSSYGVDKVIFKLWCGLTIEIQDYSKYTAEKISEAYKCFKGLSGEEYLKGRIICLVDFSGVLKATYYPNAK